jgi:tRNA(Ile)-lysidine synthase
MLVEVAIAGHGSASIPRTAEIRRLCGRPEGGSVDLGGGVTIAVESGMVVVLESGEIRQGPEPAILDLPGEVEWGAWRLAAERIPGPVRARGPEVATLDAAGLPDRIEVRAWCEGDRIRQLGMAGSKPVADILAERGIRRTERRTHPVVVAAGEVVWVPGMAVADRLRIAPDTPEVVLLTADRSGNTGAP